MSKNLTIPLVGLLVLIISLILIQPDFILAAKLSPSLSPGYSSRKAGAGSNNPRLSVQVGTNSLSLPVVCNPDVSMAVTSHADGVSRLWDLKTGGEIRRFAKPIPAAMAKNWIKGSEFTPDGKALFTYDGNNIIRFWDIATGEELKSFRADKNDSANMATLSPKADKVLVGLRVFGAGKQGVVARLWNVTSQKEIQRFKGLSSGANVVTFSPDGNTILTGEGPIDSIDSILRDVRGVGDKFNSTEVAARLWDVASGKVIHEFKGHPTGVTSVAYSKNGRSVAIGSFDGTVSMWEVSSGRNIGTFSPENKTNITALSISEGNSKLTVGDRGGQIRIWDVASGQVVKSLTLPPQRSKRQSSTFFDAILGPAPVDASLSPVSVSAFSPDWKLAFTKDADVWDLETGKLRYSLRSYSHYILTAGLTSDNRSMIVGRSDGKVQIWDLLRGRILREFGEEFKRDDFSLQSEGTRGMAISPGGEKAYIFKNSTVALSSSQSLGVWDIGEGKKVGDLTGPQSSSALSTSPDGRYLLAARREGIYPGRAFADLWDIASGKRLQSIEAEGSSTIEAITISPDNKLIATGETRDLDWLFRTKGLARIWDASSGKEYKRFVGHSAGVVAVAFSPDGSMLLTGSEDGTAMLWRIQGDELKRFTGHVGTVTAVGFSPDMQTVVTGGSDGSIRIWSIKRGQQVQSFDGQSGGVDSIKVSADGTKIVSMGTDGSAMLWDISGGRNIIRLLSMLDGTWVIITPDGRFDTNNLEGIKGLNWVMPDDPLHALPLEIFMRDYYEPRLLPHVLKDSKSPNQPSISELNRVQPKIGKITVTPQAGKSDLVDVTVEVSSVPGLCLKGTERIPCESGVYDLRLYRDGQLVRQASSADTSSVKAGEGNWREQLQQWRKSNEVKTKDGYLITVATGSQEIAFTGIHLPQRSDISQVEFTAYAFNEDRVKSQTTPPFVYPLGKRAGGARRLAYLITVGVNANQSGWNLEFAARSAEDLRGELRERLSKDYEVVDVSLLSTLEPDSPRVALKQATKRNIQAVLDLLAGRPIDDSLRAGIDPAKRLRAATPDDLVLLFISSHGYADLKGNFYVIPYDTGKPAGVTEVVLNNCLSRSGGAQECEPAQVFIERSISSDDLTRWWAGVDAGEMVMILDSCYSAAVTGRAFRPGPLGDSGFGQLSYDKQMLILTAAQPDKPALATLREWGGRSLLSGVLIDTLETIPQQNLLKWLKETERSVPELYRKFYPNVEDDDIQFPVLLDFSRRRATAQIN